MISGTCESDFIHIKKIANSGSLGILKNTIPDFYLLVCSWNPESVVSIANGKHITNKRIVKIETVIEIIYAQLLLTESKIQEQIFLRAFTMDHFLMSWFWMYASYNNKKMFFSFEITDLWQFVMTTPEYWCGEGSEKHCGLKKQWGKGEFWECDNKIPI